MQPQHTEEAFTPDAFYFSIGRERKLLKFLIYTRTRFYSPVRDISWNFMKQFKKKL